MALAYRSGSFVSAGNASGGDLTLTKPTGTTDGDLVVVGVYFEPDTTTISISPGTWESVTIANTGAFKLTYFVKVASSEPASYTISNSTAGNQWRAAVGAAYSGGTGSGTRIDVSGTNQGDAALYTAQTAPSVTTTGTNRMLIFGYGNFNGDNVPATTGAATNLRGSFGSTTIADALRASAGATGTTGTTVAMGSEDFGALHIALISDTGGGAGAALDGTSAGTATAAATALRLSHALGGSVAATATGAATRLTMPHPLAGTSAGAATASAAQLTLSHPLTGTVAGAATSDATALTVGHILTGASAGVSTVAGSLAGTAAALDGTSAGAATAAALRLTLSHALGGSAAGAATAGATALTLSHPLAGTSAATSTAAATGLALAHALTGTVAGQATAAGALAAPLQGNRNISAGAGYVDSNPKQLVRTSADRLYLVVNEMDAYPFQAGDRLIVYRADQTGVPSTFTQLIQTGITDIGTVAAALNAGDDIEILTTDRSGNLRYRIWDTGTDTMGSATTIDTGLESNLGQGDTNAALALDSAGVAHIVYLKSDGTRRRVYYRNNSGGTWSAATEVSSGVTFGTNEKAWLPNIAIDGSDRALVTWFVGTFNATADGELYSRVRSGGSFGSTVNISGANNAWIEIDQSGSLLITTDGRYHVAYVDAASNTNEAIRYAYSDDQGASWTHNNPSPEQKTHNPTLGYGANGLLRIYGHGTPNASDHGENLYFFEAAGGSAAWGTWTLYVTGTNYDSSVATRWSRHFFAQPATVDVAYWNDNYPNALSVGSERPTTAAALAGAVAATATAQATGLRLSHALGGTIAATATADAARLALAHALTGTSAGSATASALQLALAHPLAGTVAGAATADATRLTLAHALAGLAAGFGAATAALTGAGPSPVAVDGRGTWRAGGGATWRGGSRGTWKEG